MEMVQLLWLQSLFLPVFYLIILVAFVWFAVKFANSHIKAQNERNQLLREISKQLKGMNRKEE